MCMNRPIRAIDSEWTPPRRTSGRAALAAAINWALLTAICLNIGMAFAFLRQWYLDRHPLTGPSSVVAGSSSPQWVDDRPVFFSTNQPNATDMKPDIIDADFLRALSEVESGTNDLAVNKREDAHGRYQIRAQYLKDANEFLGTSYSLEDMHDPEKANTVVWAYLARWGTIFEQHTGREATATDLARIHNGGPRGAEKDATVGYSMRFLAALSRDAR